jgi:hypothetical protein
VGRFLNDFDPVHTWPRQTASVDHDILAVDEAELAQRVDEKR